MSSVVYDRVRHLCEKHNVSISRVENSVGFGNSTISKWESSSPSVEKLRKVADYFDVSVDYLMGRSDDETPVSYLLSNDKDIIQLCRAREKMPQRDRDQMMRIESQICVYKPTGFAHILGFAKNCVPDRHLRGN